jgi:iron complex outermembrane receptor protein
VSSAQAHACKPASSEPAAAWPAPLDRPVTIRATGLTLRDALDRVGAIAKIRLSYSSEALPLSRAVCLAAEGDPAGKILAELTAGTNVVAVPAGGDQVALTPRQQTAPPPQPTPAPEMAPSVGLLDRVVVTGTAVPAPERELTVAVNVLSGRQLARENTSTLSSALDNYVPGMWSWAQSPVSVSSSYASIRGASSFGVSYPKIYIDGIEVANPLLVSRFAPEAIDHVEVIRGPQGSALYGADAISGVVNIVSRHDGRDGERGSVRSSAGVTQSAFSHGALSQQHDLSLFTGTSTGSADLHVSGGTTGAFIPNAYSRDLLANGSARYVGEKSTVTATARFFAQEAGTATSPLLSRSSSPTGLSEQNTSPQSVREYTVGTNATYSASERWTHTLVAGIDGYRLANVESSFTAIPRGADSALRAAEGRADRATIRATSILNLRSSEPTRLSLTMSAEHSALHEVTETRAMGMRELTSWQTSTGLTGSASAALDNTVFLTGGLRVERDSRLPDNEVALLPMLGVATVHDIGPAMIKLRAAYGQGIRPSSTVAHSAFWQTHTSSNQTSLGAERQSGVESGIDVMFDRALTLKVTRFDQHASGLIQQVVVPATTDPTSHKWDMKLENVGEIANRGWELEAQTAISRLSITGTMSFVDSRVQHLARGYTGDLQTGDRMLQVPSRTASLNLSWLGRRWYASVSGSHAFNWVNYDELALSEMFLNTTHPAGELSGARLREYWRDYTGSLRVRATVSRDLFDRFAVELSGENLLGHQLNEPDNMTVLPGRTVMTGVRLKF